MNTRLAFVLACLAPASLGQVTVDFFDLDDTIYFVPKLVNTGVSESEHFYLGLDLEPRMIEFADRQVYVGEDDSFGLELLAVSAAGGGSALFADWVPGPGSSAPRWLTEHGGALFAWGTPADPALALQSVRYLYVADGTVAGTGAVVDASSPGMPLGFTPEHAPRFLANDKVIARGKESNGDAHVYSIDLVAGSVERLSSAPTNVSGVHFPREICVDATGTFAVYFAVVGGAPTLMRTDGSAAGTVALRTFEQPNGTVFENGSWSESVGLLEWNGHIYLPGYAAPDGLGLWRTDGTSVGTTLVKAFNDNQSQAKHLDLERGARFGTGFVLHYVRQGDLIPEQEYFHEVWRSDGTSAGTNYWTGLNASSAWGRYVPFAGDLYFQYNGVLRSLLSPTSFTSLLPPEMLLDSLFAWNRNGYFVEGNRLWFATYDPVNGPTWSSMDAGGAIQVEVAAPASGRALWPDTLGRDAAGNTVFFAGYGAQGLALWRQAVGQVAPVFVEWARRITTPSSQPGGYVAFGPDAELFTARDLEATALPVRTPWVHRANGAVEELAPLRDPLAVASTFHVGLVGGTFAGYFIASEPAGGRELWRTDGTSAGTERVLDFTPGAADTVFGDLLVHGGKLYFVAHRTGRDPVGVAYLWAFDGAAFERLTTVPTKDALAAAGQHVVFSAESVGLGFEPWTTDGTVAGTALLVDLAPGAASSAPAMLTRVGGRVAFTADDGSAGRELWSTDGTASGTQQVVDLNPGAGSTKFNTLLDASTSGKETLIVHAGSYYLSDLAVGGAALMALPSGGVHSTPEPITQGGWLIFSSRDPVAFTYDLWRSDGTNVERLTTFDFTSNKTHFKDLTASASRVHVLAASPTLGVEPFDVLSGGQLVAETVVGYVGGFNAGATPYELVANGDRLYLSQFHPSLGYELMVLQLEGASVAELGSGSVGGAALQSTLPVLGSTVTVKLDGAPFVAPSFLIMSGPVSQPQWLGGVPDVVSWLDSATAHLLATFASPSATLQVTLPMSPALSGSLVHLQSWSFLNPTVAPQTSNGLRLRLGQ